MKNLKTILEQLEKLLANFKKSPKRIYSASYLLTKRALIDRLKTEFINDYTQLSKNEKDICEQLIRKFQSTYRELENYIRIKTEELSEILENSISEEEEENNTDLANSGDSDCEMASFDITTTMKLVPEFNGDPKSLTNFINLIEFLNDSIEKEEEKGKLINFIIKTKLSERARNKISNEKMPKSFTELQTLFRKIFKTHSNPLKIQSELSRSYQGEKSVQDFSNKIESLVAELNSIQINEQGESNRDIIAKLNDQLALNAFKSGLREPLKSTIFAAQPKTLAAAVEIATEIETDNRQTRNILRFSAQRPGYTNQRNNQRFQGNFHPTYRRGQNHRNPQNNTFHNRSRQMEQNRNNHRAQFNYNPNNSSTFVRTNRGNQNRPLRRINLINSGNGQGVPEVQHSGDEEAYNLNNA